MSLHRASLPRAVAGTPCSPRTCRRYPVGRACAIRSSCAWPTRHHGPPLMATTYRTHGLVLTEHEFEVPLDHGRPGGSRTTVLAREVAAPDGLDKPYLVYLQGGPGFEAPRPTRHPTSPGWLDRALREFRVLMLDQRGTGRSTPFGGHLARRPPAEQAEYLTHFRADAIVHDAEHVRRALGVERWSVLGQSFGGFCATTYLSLAPEGLREAL